MLNDPLLRELEQKVSSTIMSRLLSAFNIAIRDESQDNNFVVLNEILEILKERINEANQSQE